MDESWRGHVVCVFVCLAHAFLCPTGILPRLAEDVPQLAIQLLVVRSQGEIGLITGEPYTCRIICSLALLCSIILITTYEAGSCHSLSICSYTLSSLSTL